MAYRLVTFVAGDSPTVLAEMRSMLELMYRSAATQTPGCALTVLSDATTELGNVPGFASVSRHDVDRRDLMLARTRAQAEFTHSYDFAEPLAFLDLDILVTADLAPLFERSFDIAVTWRRKREMPINGGVILANNHRPDRVRRFFDALLAIYVERYAEQGAWWGDQRALDDLIAFTPTASGDEVSLTRDGVDCLVLPGSRYNFSPHWLAATWRIQRRGHDILHFKSTARKRYMRPYFEAHIAR